MSKFSRWIDRALEKTMIITLIGLIVIALLTVIIGIFTVDWIPTK